MRVNGRLSVCCELVTLCHLHHVEPADVASCCDPQVQRCPSRSLAGGVDTLVWNRFARAERLVGSCLASVFVASCSGAAVDSDPVVPVTRPADTSNNDELCADPDTSFKMDSAEPTFEE